MEAEQSDYDRVSDDAAGAVASSLSALLLSLHYDLRRGV
jgi:hypothetical protein